MFITVDFRVPLYWDSLDAQGALQMIALKPSSPEYDRVKQDFKKTAKKTVLKVTSKGHLFAVDLNSIINTE